jgi:hypothetical protein
LFRFPAQWMAIALMGFVLLAAEGSEALPPRTRLWAVGLVIVELFLFNLQSPYLWVDRTFLSDKPAVLSDLTSAGEGGRRAMEGPSVEAWRYGDLPVDPGRPDFAPWRAVKESLAPGQAEPFHVREAKSVTNHTLRATAALQAAAAKPGGAEALRRLGVSRVLSVDDPAAVAPVFRWDRVEGAWGLCRTPDGRDVKASVDETDPGVKRISLDEPWPGGVLEVGEMFYPGWSCRAGGVIRPTAPSGGAFRGISLEAGDRDVVLRDDAPLFFWGILLSWAALAWFAFAAQKISPKKPPLLGAGLAAAGVLLSAKGIYDLVAGEPYANLFAPAPWAFVPARAFVLFAVSELAAGAALLSAARKVRP